jgi:hypothetical protein
MTTRRSLLRALAATLLLAPLASTASCGGSGGLPAPLRVVIVGSAPQVQVDDLVTKLAATGFFGSVAALDARTSTPTASELDAFEVALVMSNDYFFDPVTLGDRLADAVDKGLDVVLTMFTHVVSPLSGRFAAHDLFTMDLNDPDQLYDGPFGWTANVPGHPLLDGVAQFSSGTYAYRANASPKPDAVLVASWVGGGNHPLIVERVLGNGRIRVDLNFFPVTSDVAFGSVEPDDSIRIVANALRRVGGHL